MRQIILDTETTGLNPQEGHRVIEIGCIELFNRRYTGNNFHVYINPGRTIELAAIKIHGITNEFLRDKPFFAQIAEKLHSYLDTAEIIAHNASFDIGFLNHEFNIFDKKLPSVDVASTIIDTLSIARKLHPGQRNSLDALCKRYNVDNSNREFHGALLDAKLLAEVYLAMTGGQEVFDFGLLEACNINQKDNLLITEELMSAERINLIAASINEEELIAHRQLLALLKAKSNKDLSWLI